MLHRMLRSCLPALLLAVSTVAVGRAEGAEQGPPPRAADAGEQSVWQSAQRILFLGDSITQNGQYVAWIDTQLRLQGVSPRPEILAVGLSSETCSGLSEPDHPFPRPDVHERLQRTLDRVRPDVVVACYGMNDGIYHPFSDERFAAYRDGINRLIDKVHAAGARVILLTPPPYDPVPLRDSGRLKPAGADSYGYAGAYENYNEVLAKYAAWLREQLDRVALVVDLHTPFSEFLAKERERDPQYTLSPDGIHPNAEGHRLLGNLILQAWGIATVVEPPEELARLNARRMTLLGDAWRTTIGHQRPGTRPGLPLPEAQAEAAQLERRIAELAKEAQRRDSAERQ